MLIGFNRFRLTFFCHIVVFLLVHSVKDLTIENDFTMKPYDRGQDLEFQTQKDVSVSASYSSSAVPLPNLLYSNNAWST